MKAITLSKANFARLYILISTLAIIGFLVLSKINFSGFSQQIVILTYATIFSLGLILLKQPISGMSLVAMFLVLASSTIELSFKTIGVLMLIPITCLCMAGFFLVLYSTLRNFFFKNTQRLPQTKLLLHPGLDVVVSDPLHLDSPHSHSFSGVIDSLSDGIVCVRDMDNNCWDVEHDEIIDIAPSSEGS